MYSQQPDSFQSFVCNWSQEERRRKEGKEEWCKGGEKREKAADTKEQKGIRELVWTRWKTGDYPFFLLMQVRLRGRFTTATQSLTAVTLRIPRLKTQRVSCCLSRKTTLSLLSSDARRQKMKCRELIEVVRVWGLFFDVSLPSVLPFSLLSG